MTELLGAPTAPTPGLVANAPAVFLDPAPLTTAERLVYARLRQQLKSVEKANNRSYDYLEGKQKVRQLDIAVPPQLRDLEVVAGWPGTGVSVLSERLVWENWTSTGDLMGLDQVYTENELDVESDLGTVDALTCGVGFVSVGTGDVEAGEPEILVTAESPRDCTVLWDYRLRRASAGLSRTVNDRGVVVMETLWLLGQTITLERDRNGRIVVTRRDEHGLDRIPVSRLVNRSRASRLWGASEITPAVRYYTDAAVRTLLGMEINREFYTTPQRYVLGADESMFTDENGSPIDRWKAIAGYMLAAPRPFDEETGEYGDLPGVGQFAPAPPTPYIDQMRAYSMLFAAELGVPATYLGYATDNPASADAIRAAETRLIMRSLKRQQGFNAGWRDVAYNVLLWRDRKVDIDAWRQVKPKWRDPATTTPQAAADEVTKLIASGVLIDDSGVTYDRVGLDPHDQERLAADKRRKAAAARLDGLAAAAAAARANPAVAALAGNRGQQS